MGASELSKDNVIEFEHKGGEGGGGGGGGGRCFPFDYTMYNFITDLFLPM